MKRNSFHTTILIATVLAGGVQGVEGQIREQEELPVRLVPPNTFDEPVMAARIASDSDREGRPILITLPAGGSQAFSGPLTVVMPNISPPVTYTITPEPGSETDALVNVVLQFQLIQAADGAPSDPRIAELADALLGLLRFTGYRLIGDGMVQVSDGGSEFRHLLSGSGNLTVTGRVTEIQRNAPSYARVEGLQLSDGRDSFFTTTLNIRDGQFVVVGGVGLGGDDPMFLTLRAEIEQVAAPGTGRGATRGTPTPPTAETGRAGGRGGAVVTPAPFPSTPSR